MWLCQRMTDFRSSLFRFLFSAADESNQISFCFVPHVYRYCLQAPRLPRAWLHWGSQVYHPITWPCCHCWIYHQAAVLSSWIPKGQTDICMVNRISFFLCLDLVCFCCKDVKSAVTVTVSVILIDEPHIWVYHTEPCGVLISQLERAAVEWGQDLHWNVWLKFQHVSHCSWRAAALVKHIFTVVWLTREALVGLRGWLELMIRPVCPWLFFFFFSQRSWAVTPSANVTDRFFFKIFFKYGHSNIQNT